MLMRVASLTRTASLAGAIANHLRQGGEELALQAIGAAATNQAVKALATARDFLAVEGITFTISARWVDVNGLDGGGHVSALRFDVRMDGGVG